MTITPSQLLGRIESFMLSADLPHGLVSDDVTGFVSRNRAFLLSVIAEELQGGADAADAPVEHRTARARTDANIAALHTLMELEAGKRLTPARLASLRAYTGWGGLSIKRALDRVPEGAPVPEAAGLIHEYYTPASVCGDAASILRDLWPSLPLIDGQVVGLEPAAGVGRFVWEADAVAPGPIKWVLVELSEASGRLLAAMRPNDTVHRSSFEKVIADNPELVGKVSFVLANPPYGPRGRHKTADPDRSYREPAAYKYFLRRGLDALEAQGVGIFVIPAGFMTGTGNKAVALRERVLKRHHLLSAYRLPSGLFPGAELVTDLVVFRARGGELASVAAEDSRVLAGAYFEDFPAHVLGEEVGKVDPNATDVSKKARWGYQVKGKYKGLPAFVPRKNAAEGRSLTSFQVAPKAAGRRGAIRRLSTDTAEDTGADVAWAARLGGRLDSYLKVVADGDSDQANRLHGELKLALLAWSGAHGNPAVHAPLRQAAASSAAVARFLTAWTPSGTLIDGVDSPPKKGGNLLVKAGNIVAIADYLRSRREPVTVESVSALWTGRAVDIVTRARKAAAREALPVLDGAGWIEGEPGVWMHPEDFLTGELWPRVDRIEDAVQGRTDAWRPVAELKAMRDRLVAAIAPLRIEDMGALEPRLQWIPLAMVSEWIEDEFGVEVELERVGGLVLPKGMTYEDDAERGSIGGISGSTAWFLGWVNHDATLFQPGRPPKESGRTLDDERLRIAAEWTGKFEIWVRSDATRVRELETVYNRTARGYVAPKFSEENLNIARWATGKGAIVPHPHQNSSARRLVANNGGLAALDVGVGKTYTALVALGKFRELGRKRPMLLVPNSIIWKWVADIRRVYPDYEVIVIGAERKYFTRGSRKGQVTSRTDTAEERAAKWTRFQAGEADVVVCTYSMFQRTQMSAEWVENYVASSHNVRRMISIERRNAKKSGRRKLSERQEALLAEGTAGWVAERLELPKGHQYDPGVAWEDIGVDLMIVDEAQNFKNLYLPESREGGVPRFMGNAGKGSEQAWHLDFRLASVRQRSNGGGVVLLSATPAKNSPLEFYTMMQYVDGKCWESLGVYDSEGYIDRFIKIEMVQTVNSAMKLVKRSACTGFVRLDELRSVIFKYGEFLTAEDVGLDVPDTTVETIESAMSVEQERRYEELLPQMEAALTDRTQAGKILGVMTRMAAVCVHPMLDQGYNYKTAKSSGVDPESPRFTAIADNILPRKHCGHIVFLENTAAHAWLEQVLVDRGIKPERIAILNAIVAKAPADRQRIADAFNGSKDEPPKYDIVIANQIAYEGVDMQARTCSIHHGDLPWEPATLQQRNGRGVRQGNTLDTVAIFYYFALQSLDGLRFETINGKRGWMKVLVKSSARETTNPGASMSLDRRELLMRVSRDPERTRLQLEAMEKAARIEQMAEVARAAGRRLRKVGARFRAAERALVDTDGDAERLTAEGMLADLERVDPEAWPFGQWAHVARTTPIYVTEGGMPLWPGLIINTVTGSKLMMGRTDGGGVSVFSGQSQTWLKYSDVAIDAQTENWLDGFAVEDPEFEAFVFERTRRVATGGSPRWFTGSFVDHVAEHVLERLWSEHRQDMVLGAYSYPYNVRIPFRHNGRLAVIKTSYGIGVAPAEDVYAQTEAGWRAFVRDVEALTHPDQRRASRLVAQSWWGRKLPRNRKTRIVQ